MHEPHPFKGRLLLLFAVLLLAAPLLNCEGCNGCGSSSKAPSETLTPKERIDAYATQLPAETDLAVFFVKMDEVRSTVTALSGTFQGNLPVDAYRQEVARVLGVDLLDKASCEASGVDVEAGFVVATYKNAPVVVARLKDQAKFDQKVVASLSKFYRVKDAPKKDTSGQPALTTLSGRDNIEFSYATLEGGYVMVVGTALIDDRKPGKGGAPTETLPGSAELLREVVAGAKKGNLGATETFKAYTSEVGANWPASAYLDAKAALALFGELRGGSLKNYQKEVLGAVSENLTWTGIGVRATAEKGTELEVFLGAKKETLDSLKGVDAPVKGSPKFRLMVSDRAYLVARSSLNAEVFWREYKKLLPPSQKRYIERILGNIKASTQIDIEKDVIENATGNGLIAVYGLDLGKLSARRATERMAAVSGMVIIQLKDEKRFTAVLDRLVSELRGALRRTPLPGGLIAYGFNPNSSTAPPFTLYLREDLAIIASNALTPDTVRQVIAGEKTTLVKKVESEAARTLLSSDKGTGLYLNVERISKKLGGIGSGLIEALIGPIADITIAFELKGSGVSARLNVTFVKEGKKEAQKPDLVDDQPVPKPLVVETPDAGGATPAAGDAGADAKAETPKREGAAP